MWPKRNPMVIDMVHDSLKAGGYEGLVEECGECACELDDLAPCGEMGESCTAGYKTKICPEGCEPGCDFYIVMEPTP